MQKFPEEMNDMLLGWELAMALLGMVRQSPWWVDALQMEWYRRGLTFDEVADQLAGLDGAS